jgi:hypothetical protein
MSTSINDNDSRTGITIMAQPGRITAGGIVTVIAELPMGDKTYDVEWTVLGPVRLSASDRRIALLGATSVTGEQVTLSDETTTPVEATLDTGPLAVGAWMVGLQLTEADDLEGPDFLEGVTEPIDVAPRPFAAGDDVAVTMKRTAVPPTEDQALWVAIRHSTNALGFDSYSRFIEAALCDGLDYDAGRLGGKRLAHRLRKAKRRTGLPFPNVDRYRLLKAATEVFLMTHCGVDLDDFSQVDLEEEGGRLNREVDVHDLESAMREYLLDVPTGEGESLDVLPYLGLIRLQLGDVTVVGRPEGDDEAASVCYGILAEKLTNPCFLELINPFWHDEGNVVEAINSISRRFQNRTSAPPGRDPLAGLDVDPLRPLNNLLWGLVQDRQHRLTTARRNIEYSHHYGVGLSSRPPVRGADPRSRFMSTFHHLLSLCSAFYEQDDNTTVIADGFGVLNALKSTHLLLTEGAHNQYGDLPWTARHEMLMYQWILSRPEMRSFLPTRTMVVYPEGWIASVEAINKLQGWSDVPALHFRDLAVFGEQLLLSIRFGAWTAVIDPAQAANWARYWRPEVQGYIHAYRAVRGADLTQRGERAMQHRLRRRVGEGAFRG